MILDSPAVSRLFQRSLGSHRCAQRLAERHFRVRPGHAVLDMGCSVGEILSYLPEVRYTGVDRDQRAIAYAQKKYGARGRFVCADILDHLKRETGRYDIFLAIGFLHHLGDDAATAMLEQVKRHMGPGSRLITVDGCLEHDQPWMAKWLLNNDRGRHMRTEQGYLGLAKTCFENITFTVERDLLRVPYTHLIMEISPSGW